MKIIIAGYSKTGTKSMAIALKKLGYDTIYDLMEHYWYHGKDWMKIFSVGDSDETTAALKRMYKDIDVIMDIPVYFFWEEIHRAFPDAKIILTIRDEDKWYKSWSNQLKLLNKNRMFNLLQTFSPSGRGYFSYISTADRTLFGFINMTSPWKEITANEVVSRRSYRQHNAYVMQNAPKDKLLVYSVKEGWEPLCTFLGKDIPETPFPHKNSGGAVYDDLVAENPAVEKMQKEMKIVAAVLGLGIGLLGLAAFLKTGIKSPCFSMMKGCNICKFFFNNGN